MEIDVWVPSLNLGFEYQVRQVRYQMAEVVLSENWIF